MRIANVRKQISHDTCFLSADLISAKYHDTASTLWFQFPAPYAGSLTDLSDPFLIGILPLCMLINEPIKAEGRISGRLLTGIDQIMRILNRWYPHLGIIDIRPEGVSDERYSPDATAGFFTAGVDSFYTLLKSLDLEQGQNRISHLIHVRGFDMDLNNTGLYSRLQQHIRKSADSLGLNVIFAASNLREITDRASLPWFLQQGAALSSIAHCLSPLFRRVKIAATSDYLDHPNWGIHPCIDPLWSTDSTEILHDGCELRRSQKVLRYIAKNPVAMQHLRGCWNRSGEDYNCGTCVKCLVTMINLASAGSLEECETFGDKPDLPAIARIGVNTEEKRYYLEDSLRTLKSLQTLPELQQAMRTALKSYPGGTRSLRRVIRSLDDILFAGSLRKWHGGMKTRQHRR